jgi:carbon monoxide dehydrogenase subunit G
MHLEKEFTVERDRAEVARNLDANETFVALFPDTEITRQAGSLRETLTRVSIGGIAKELRFVFETGSDGNIDFHKVCDGKIWKELKGRIRLDVEGAGTRVRVSMDGRTRALVPEVAISGQMKSQLDDMVGALQDRIRSA